MDMCEGRTVCKVQRHPCVAEKLLGNILRYASVTVFSQYASGVTSTAMLCRGSSLYTEECNVSHNDTIPLTSMLIYSQKSKRV